MHTLVQMQQPLQPPPPPQLPPLPPLPTVQWKFEDAQTTLSDPKFKYDGASFELQEDFPTVIISYATQSNGGSGQEDMWAIANVLRKNNITSFNGKQVKPGENWQEKWYGKMPEAKICVLILSEEYFTSQSCITECLEAVKQQGKIDVLPIQFGTPNMSGDFLGTSTKDKEKANIIKQRILNWLPPPDQGRFQDNFERNAKALVLRICVILGASTQTSRAHDRNPSISPTSRPEPPALRLTAQRICVVCRMHYDQESGCLCTQEHFVCDSCLDQHVNLELINAHPSSEILIFCPESGCTGCESKAYETADLAKHIQRSTLQAYLEAPLQFQTEKEMARIGESEQRAKQQWQEIHQQEAALEA